MPSVGHDDVVHRKSTLRNKLSVPHENDSHVINEAPSADDNVPERKGQLRNNSVEIKLREMEMKRRMSKSSRNIIL